MFPSLPYQAARQMPAAGRRRRAVEGQSPPHSPGLGPFNSALLGPDTPMGQFIGALTTVLSHSPVTSPAATVHDPVKTALSKRLIERCPVFRETDIFDPIKMIAWLQAAERLEQTANDNFATALTALELTAELDANNPICSIVLTARALAPQNKPEWTSTCGLILSTIPDIVHLVEASIKKVAPRAPSEDVTLYYHRYQVALGHAHYVRTHLGKDVGVDWLRPHLERWARKIGNSSWTAVLMSLPATSTLSDYYAKAIQAIRAIPESAHN
jgi:hypothetical protein